MRKEGPEESFKKLNEVYRKLGPYLNLGLTMALTMLAGLAAGYYLDRKFNTMPLLVIIGSLLGTIMAFVNFFKTVKNLNNKEDQ